MILRVNVRVGDGNRVSMGKCETVKIRKKLAFRQ
jgi:hypothetical protein